MAKKTHLECDGCGKAEVVEQGSRPAHIKEGIAVALKGDTKSYDLCFMCEKTLTNYTNPKRWPRAVCATPSE